MGCVLGKGGGGGGGVPGSPPREGRSDRHAVSSRRSQSSVSKIEAGADVADAVAVAVAVADEAAAVTKTETAVVEKPRRRRSGRPGGNVPGHVRGEQVAAGWPAWLSAVAGEAIKGWTPRRADTFEKLDKVRDLESFELSVDFLI